MFNVAQMTEQLVTRSERVAVHNAARHIVTSGAPIPVIESFLDSIELYAEQNDAHKVLIWKCLIDAIEERLTR